VHVDKEVFRWTALEDHAVVGLDDKVISGVCLDYKFVVTG